MEMTSGVPGLEGTPKPTILQHCRPHVLVLSRLDGHVARYHVIRPLCQVSTSSSLLCY